MKKITMNWKLIIHNNDSYNEYGGQARMTYDDLNRVVSAKVCGSMLWMVLGLLVTGITGYMVYTGLVSGNPVAYGILKMYCGCLPILEIACGVWIYLRYVYKANSSTLRLMFLAYSFLNGLTFSVLGIVYAPGIYSFGIFGNICVICSFGCLWLLD